MAEEKKTTAKKATTTKAAAEKKAPAKKPAAPKAEPEKKAEAAKAEPAKKAPAKKEAKKVEEKPAKPAVTSAKAVAKDVRVTPRKARLVLDLIRGKAVNEALGILSNVNKAASPIVAKVVKSAAANAINNFGMSEEKLYVAECYAGDGIKMKRYLPRAKGSASGLVKRASHITVVVKER
ncbi:MAG: 50S ribosomal protein L22 [Bacilli bacterium]|nr:50S ribosomal protein L22 [Bacilli bacterium]